MEKLPVKWPVSGSLLSAEFDAEFGFNLDDESWLVRARSCSENRALGAIGPFELLAEAGRGGQGIVYKARQPRTGRIIAIKRLSAGAFATPQMRSRFEREIEAAAALEHPNIVTVFGSEIVDGEIVLAMQWVDGEPIERWASREDRANEQDAAGSPAEGRERNRRSQRQVLEAFEKVCAAVHHAHQRGVIHRDIKPSNILVDADHQPHVLDFGLAKLFSPYEEGSAFQTHTTGFIGTPAYASPEQLGAEDGVVDVRSDVFSLGCTLYHALTGRLPHPGRGSIASMMRTIEQYDPCRPSAIRPQLGPEVDAILLKCLAKQKEERYPSIGAFGEDLRRYLNSEPVLAHPPSTWYQVRKIIRRHRTAFTLSAALLFLIVVSAVTATVLAIREHRSRLEAQTAREAEKNQREEAEWNAYAASLAAADAALQAEDFTRAQEHLKRAPERLRHWEWLYLARQADASENTTQLGQRMVALNAEGQLLAACDGSKLLRFPHVPGDAVAVFAIDRYGSKAISRDFNYFSLVKGGYTSLHEATGETIARLDHLGSGCLHLRFTPDDRTLIATDDFGQLRVHPLASVMGIEDAQARLNETKQPLPLPVALFPLHANQAESLTLSDDGRRVATGAGDGMIQIFDLRERRIHQTLATGERSISALAFSPAGNHLAAGSWDRQVRVWDLDTQRPVWTGDEHRDLVSALTYRADGRIIASGSMDRTIRLWNAVTGECLARLAGHETTLTGIALLSDDRLASYDLAGTLKTWHWQPDAVPVARGQFNRIVDLATSRNAKQEWLAVSEGPDSSWRNPRVSIVDARRRSKIGALYVEPKLQVSALDVSADAKWLALGSTDGSVLLWEGNQISRWVNGPDATPPSPTRVVPPSDDSCSVLTDETGISLAPWGQGPSCWVVSLSLHPDNRRLALARFDGTIEIRDLESGECLYRNQQSPGSKSRSCAFSPNGDTFAVIEGHTLVCMHRTADGALLAQSKVEGSSLTSATRFSPDGSVLAPLMFGSEIRLLRTTDLSEVRRFQGHSQLVNSVAFTADGSRLISAAQDATIRIWDVGTGREVFSLRGHQFSANGLAFTSNGQTLVSGGSDNTIRFWDAAR